MGPGRATERERSGPINREGTPGNADKIGPAADDLRDHDFPVPPHEGRPGNEDVMVDQGVPDPETVEAGGEPGTIKGDRQQVGEVGAIIDQYEMAPDFSQTG